MFPTVMSWSKALQHELNESIPGKRKDKLVKAVSASKIHEVTCEKKRKVKFDEYLCLKQETLLLFYFPS